MTNQEIKILLIQPPTNINLKIESGLKYPPMGIAFLAAAIRDQGYSVKIFDANVEKNPFDQLLIILNKYQPQVVGLSFTSLLANSAHHTAELIKKHNPNITILAGGYHPTVMPLEVIKDPNFDFVFIGEGEQSLFEWLEQYKNQQTNFNQIKGLVFRLNDKIIQTEPRELIANLDDIPFPAYNLLPIDKYSSLASTRKPYVTFIRSRGCPFRCLFCGVQKMFGRRYRCQSPAKTISEIDILVRDFGIKEINFKDSDFLIDKTNVIEFCRLLITRKYDLIWTCNARVDMINEEILKLMQQAGCRLITYGVESGSQEILNNLKKDISLSQTEQAIQLTKKIGIRCALDIILGGIGETQATFKQTLSFIKKLNPDYVAFTYLTAFPGSELYAEALKNNWFIGGQTDNYSYENLQLNATRLSDAELAKIYKQALKSFYLRPSYIVSRIKHLTFSDIKNNFIGLWSVLKSAFSTD